MADKKITELPAATLPIAAGVKFEAVQGGINVQVDADDMPGGGGTITSVNGDTGPVVVLDATDVGADPAGSASAAQSAAIAAGVTATVGVQDLFVPASAMWPRVTNGSSQLTQIEMATSLFNIQVLAFDQTNQEFAQFQIALPRKWNNGTVTVVPYWTAPAGSGTVQWGISGGAYRNDDALTVAFGTPQTSDDTLLATNDLHIGPETSAITLAGTVQDADFLAFQVSRNPASDTLNGDAYLLGISIRVTTDAAKDQ